MGEVEYEITRHAWGTKSKSRNNESQIRRNKVQIRRSKNQARRNQNKINFP
jgi:hypothetical protein